MPDSAQPEPKIGVQPDVMKKLIVFCLVLASASLPLSAQNTQQPPDPAPGVGGPGSKPHGKMHGPSGPGLTADEKQRLDAAREKAKDNPTVRSLREAKQKLEEQLDSAVHAAMLSADPSLGPTLDKIKAARDRAKEMKGKFESLTPEQKKRLKDAREAAKNDPAVQAAGKNIQSAQGPEAKREAVKALHDAMKAAVLKANPDLAPLLEKLGPPTGPMGHRGRGPHGSDDGEDGPPAPEMDGPEQP